MASRKNSKKCNTNSSINSDNLSIKDKIKLFIFYIFASISMTIIVSGILWIYFQFN